MTAPRKDAGRPLVRCPECKWLSVKLRRCPIGGKNYSLRSSITCKKFIPSGSASPPRVVRLATIHQDESGAEFATDDDGQLWVKVDRRMPTTV
jgi:hypothetical protein